MISLRTYAEAGAALALFIAIPLANHAGYERGKRDEQSAQQARNVVARDEAQARTDKAAQASSQVGEKVEAARVEVRTVTQTLIREVPRYVTVASDAQCSVPAGFVRLHDAAAAGVLPQAPDPAGQPADAPSGIALSAVAATVADNYGGCREDREALKGWQDWWATVGPAFSGS